MQKEIMPNSKRQTYFQFGKDLIADAVAFVQRKAFLCGNRLCKETRRKIDERREKCKNCFKYKEEQKHFVYNIYAQTEVQ